MLLFVGSQEDPLLRARAFNFVVFNNKFLLQHLDGIKPLRRFCLRQHHLSKVTLAQHGKKIEVVKAHLAATDTRCCGCCRFLRRLAYYLQGRQLWQLSGARWVGNGAFDRAPALGRWGRGLPCLGLHRRRHARLLIIGAWLVWQRGLSLAHQDGSLLPP